MKNASSMNELPHPGRFFGIRFESIGGLGAHAAGQILGGAAVLRLGFNGAHFSSYGSEKKGSVVRSFVRIGEGDRPLRTSAPIEKPDVIVVFHAALLKNPVTFAGLLADGTLIVNATEMEESLSHLVRLPKTARVIRVDALKIAQETRSRANAVLLGTLSAAYPFLRPEKILEALSEEFAGKHPEAVASNEKAFTRGAAEFTEIPAPGKADGDIPIVRPGPVWGYKTAPIGGVIPNPGNTISNDLSTSRTGWIPFLNKDRCVHCGLCDVVCPDHCLVWEKKPAGDVRLKGVDYRYCKGCLRCVETCSTGAFQKKEETPGLADRLRIPLFEETGRNS